MTKKVHAKIVPSETYRVAATTNMKTHRLTREVTQLIMNITAPAQGSLAAYEVKVHRPIVADNGTCGCSQKAYTVDCITGLNVHADP